jgi:hypothetical protein
VYGHHSGYGVGIAGFDNISPFDDITLKNMDAVAGCQVDVINGLVSGGNTTVNSLKIDGINLNAVNFTSSSLFTSDVNTVIHRLSITNAKITDSRWAASQTVYAINLLGIVDETDISDSILSAGANSRFAQMNGSFQNITLNSIRQTSGDILLGIGPGVTAVDSTRPTITVSNTTVKSSTLVVTQSSCAITLLGNTSYDSGNGLVKEQGTGNPGIDIFGTGNKYNLSDPFFVDGSSGGGTPSVSLHTWDAQVDVSGTHISKANGNYCYNTNAALGTLGAAGPVMANGTHWYLMTNPTLYY